MKRNYFFIAALLCCMVFISCKKNDTVPIAKLINTEDPIENLKSAYKAAIKDQPAQFAASAKMGGTPQWSNTLISTDKSTYLTPLFVKGLKRNYKAILTTMGKDGAVLQQKYVYLLTDTKYNKEIPPNLLTTDFFKGNVTTTVFTGALVEYSLQNKLLGSKHFENGKIIAGTTDQLSPGKSSTAGGAVTNLVNGETGGSNCTDWYWVIREDGVIISSEYLYTTCDNNEDMPSPEGGGGGGSGGQNGDPDGCEQALEDIQNMSSYTVNHSSSVRGAEYIENNEIVAPKSSKGGTHGFHIGWYSPEWTTYYTGKVFKEDASATWKWKDFAFDSFTQSSGSLPPTVTAAASATISTAISGDGSLASANGSCHVILSSSCIMGGAQIGGFNDPIYESFASQ